MKISLNWLSDFIDLTEKDPQEIGRRVTAGVAEVDDVEVQGGLLSDLVVVGKVLSVKKHPGADRLSLCEVQTDKGVKPVVCGGSNLRAGMRVVLAHVGALVRWHGTEMMTLQRAKIRGEDSQGMICASAELDLDARFPAGSDKEIIDLGDGDDGVGKTLRDHLGLDDVILHIDNHAITHRADLFSHIGFAREFVALGLGTWNPSTRLRAGKKKAGKGPAFAKKPSEVRCVVDDTKLVPRYCACLLEIDGLGETPLWMKKRLEATGWRSLNLPIDITNYVAMEQGMPLHSFDAGDIRGEAHIRGSLKGEKIVTLDNVKRDLPEGSIVISDDDGIFDLLGIMGGLRSSTKDSTKRIYLHSAIVDPVAIRKTVIATGHRTDAATTYEKGVPRVTAMRGLTRAIELFLELVPGAKIVSKLEEWGDEGKAKPIELPLERVEKMLGVAIPEKKIVQILEDLEFSVKREKRKEKSKKESLFTFLYSLSVTPPLHRLGDIRGPHDLIEEIGRVYGYNEIKAELPPASITPPPRDMRTHVLRDAFKGQRYVELVPVSIVGPTLLKKAGFDPSHAAAIQNPIGEELSLMHMSTLPSLLEHAERNILHAGPVLKTLHMAHVFEKGKPERPELGVLLGLMQGNDDDIRTQPLLLLKRDLEAVFRPLGYTLQTVAGGTATPYVHPGRSAELFIVPIATAKDPDALPSIKIGMLFEIHPAIRQAFGLQKRAAAALIDMSAVLAQPAKPTVPMPVPQFPAVSYDVTLTQSQREQAGEILRSLRGSDPLLESVEVVDLYSGKNMPADEYSITIRFTYRAPDRTLSEDEVKTAHEKVLKVLEE